MNILPLLLASFGVLFSAIMLARRATRWPAVVSPFCERGGSRNLRETKCPTTGVLAGCKSRACSQTCNVRFAALLCFVNAGNSSFASKKSSFPSQPASLSSPYNWFFLGIIRSYLQKTGQETKQYARKCSNSPCFHQ